MFTALVASPLLNLVLGKQTCQLFRGMSGARLNLNADVKEDSVQSAGQRAVGSVAAAISGPAWQRGLCPRPSR